MIIFGEKKRVNCGECGKEMWKKQSNCERLASSTAEIIRQETKNEKLSCVLRKRNIAEDRKNKYAPVAQMDRAIASDAMCRWFDSSRVYQDKKSEPSISSKEIRSEPSR